MSLVVIMAFLTFLFYYFACLDSINPKVKMVSLFSFVIVSIVLRNVLNPDLNNDYFLYFDFKIFHKPKDFLSVFFTEPYLYVVYVFFDFISNDKATTFLYMYWFNFAIAMLFFVWLLTRKDVDMWKKMFLFSCYYFFFGFVLLRNAPVYMLFGYYFYYTFREKKFNLVLLTPFMHISSSLMLVTFFHKTKHYFAIFTIVSILTPIIFFLLMPILSETLAFRTIVSKIHYYSSGMSFIGVLHKLFFLCITVLVALGCFLYKKQMLNKIIITTIVVYYITYFINPLVGFRYSPYVFLALFFFNFEELINEKKLKILNYSTILLLPFFIYGLYHTHHL